MKTGSLTLNGVTNSDLMLILDLVDKSPATTFAPNLLQPQNGHVGNRIVVNSYNNCVLQFQSPDAFKTVYAIMHRMLSSSAGQEPVRAPGDPSDGHSTLP